MCWAWKLGKWGLWGLRGSCKAAGPPASMLGLEAAPSHRRQSAHPAAIKCIQVHTAAPSLVPRRPRALIVLCCRQPVRRCRVVLYLYILTLTATSAALLYFYAYQVKAPSSYVPACRKHRARAPGQALGEGTWVRAPSEGTWYKGNWRGHLVRAAGEG